MQLSLPKVFYFSPLIILIFFMFSWINHVNTIPQAPVYGNSIKNSESFHTRAGIYYPLVNFNYKSRDSHTSIIEFYEKKGECIESDLIKGRTICYGNAVPFGEYSVYIDRPDNDEALTSFSLEITWER